MGEVSTKECKRVAMILAGESFSKRRSCSMEQRSRMGLTSS